MLVLQEGVNAELLEMSADEVKTGLIDAASAALLERPTSAIVDPRLQLPELPLGLRLESCTDPCGNIYYTAVCDQLGCVMVQEKAGTWTIIWSGDQLHKVCALHCLRLNV